MTTIGRRLARVVHPYTDYEFAIRVSQAKDVTDAFARNEEVDTAALESARKLLKQL